MKRFYILIIFSLSLYKNYSQTILTNGMVYNYMVGDTFQYVNTPNLAGPPRYSTQVVTQKIIKIDTIIYQMHEDYYIPPGCMSCSSTSGTNSYSFQVTNLNAFALHFTPSSNTVCTVQSDTSYINSCGKIINKRFNTITSSCFEPTMYSSYLLEGVGLYYNYTIYNSLPPGAGNSIDLIYYHKVGQSPCGSNGMPLIVKENRVWDRISIFPNPVINNIVSIKNTSMETLNVTVNSIDGREVLNLYLENTDSQLKLEIERGVYFMKIQKNSSSDYTIQKIIIE